MNVTLITLNGPPLIGRSSEFPTFIRACNFILMDLGAESAVSRVKSYSLLTLKSKANPRAHPYQDSY